MWRAHRVYNPLMNSRELIARLEAEGEMPVPGYFMRHGKFVRDMV